MAHTSMFIRGHKEKPILCENEIKIRILQLFVGHLHSIKLAHLEQNPVITYNSSILQV